MNSATRTATQSAHTKTCSIVRWWTICYKARESAMRQTAMQCAISRDRVEAPTRRQRLYCIPPNRIERPHQEDATSKKHRGCYAIRKHNRRTRLRRNSVRPRRSCDGQEYAVRPRSPQTERNNESAADVTTIPAARRIFFCVFCGTLLTAGTKIWYNMS